MVIPNPSITVNVDPANPGQFFACCGLLELADRLWPGAVGWFSPRVFQVATSGTLGELVQALTAAEFSATDADDKTASPILIGEPFRPLALDWWRDARAGGRDLKVWAGTMESTRIALAMRYALRNPEFHAPDCLNIGVITYDPENPEKKVEPFYFDARRAPNAHSRDVGFSPNDLHLTTTAFPAVELLCLCGLQRCLPSRTDRRRVFRYHTWTAPLPPELVPAAVAGEMSTPGSIGFEFENWYRTGQKKHKAFRSAIPLSNGE